MLLAVHSVVAELYYQLYKTISTLKHISFPCICALLKDMNQEIYDLLYHTLNNLIDDLHQTVITSVFDARFFNIIETNFPDARVFVTSYI